MSIGGGSNESSGSSQQGFRDLPPEIQNAFKALATQAQSYLPGAQGNTGGATPVNSSSSSVSTQGLSPAQAQTGIFAYNSQGRPMTADEWVSFDPVARSQDPRILKLREGAATGPNGTNGQTQYTSSQGVGGSSSPTGGSTSMFTPMGITGMEQSALSRISQGFTPNSQQLNSDMAMQQNPWDKYVMDDINDQAQGNFSILKQNTSQAGQFGSNRQALGANDIDMQRIGQIGTFKQGQFDKSMNNALTVLPGQRMQDAQAQMQGGSFVRGLDTQTKQAPLNALASIAQILGILPTNSGTSSQSGSGSQFSFGL